MAATAFVPDLNDASAAEAPPHHQHPLNRAAKEGLTIVLKLGTSSICDPDTHLPQLASLSLMVELVTKLRGLGHRVILVSSGAIAMGLRRLTMPLKPAELAKKQAVAAVGQGRLMALWDDLFGQLGQPIAQVLLTRHDLAQRTHYLNARNCFEALLDMGVVPIVNENDTISVGEIRFGDNDTLSAITAGMVHADFLFLMTDVDCLYTDNPRTNPDAQPIVTVHDIQTLKEQICVSDAGSSVGTGGMVTKLIAAELANAKGVDTIITRGSTALRVLDIVRELAPELCNLPATAPVPTLIAKPYYTRFVARPNPMVDRKWWILHGLHPVGTLVVDAGAMVAVAKYKKSLFAAGVVRVEGSFASNQGVRVVYETRASLSIPTTEETIDVNTAAAVTTVEIGRGLINYSSAEVKRLRGHHSSDIEQLLGYADADCLINRTNLAITVEPSVIETFFTTHINRNKIRAKQSLLIPSPSATSSGASSPLPRLANGPPASSISIS
ncbi:Glutamate 5-kinase [Tieghemiomyces parasiticus]|uniref:Glutamate 5-kinase n=1 Tax=Tieghemiomyces parasiticus TaxID=78921 RepID=A0A9W8DHP6_9FUNG|nr:Glutamate 5-kinase [Tieghemiomyces parasiticus]